MEVKVAGLEALLTKNSPPQSLKSQRGVLSQSKEATHQSFKTSYYPCMLRCKPDTIVQPIANIGAFTAWLPIYVAPVRLPLRIPELSLCSQRSQYVREPALHMPEEQPSH